MHEPLVEALVGGGRAEALITVGVDFADGSRKASSERKPP